MHNIFPSPSSVSIADRRLLNGHGGGLLCPMKSLKQSVLGAMNRLRGRSAPKQEPFKVIDDVDFKVDICRLQRIKLKKFSAHNSMRPPRGGYNATYMFANSTRNSSPNKATTKACSKSSDGRVCVAPL
jgi:hypothetical protein